MSEYYGILDELSRETPSPEVEDHIATFSDAESDSYDEIPPPLEPGSSDDEDIRIADIPLPPHSVKSEIVENIIVTPGSREMQLYSQNETVEEPQTWRSLQPGETIDEALENAKKILDNMPLSQSALSHQLMSAHAHNICTTVVPYNESVDTQRREDLDSEEVIILDDSSDYGSPEISSAGAVSIMPNDDQVIILEDSTADSEVLEVVAEKEELKPVEEKIDDDDFEITGEKEGEILSHHRCDCPLHKFTKLGPQKAPCASNMLFCDKCFCFMCDKAVSECKSWGSSQTPHCNAWKASDWNFKKTLLKLTSTEENASVAQTAAPSGQQAVSTSGWGFEDYAWHNRNREGRVRPQTSPPRWGESTWSAGGCQSWGWEQELQNRRQNDEAIPTVDLTNMPGPSTATVWGARKSSSLKREHESKGSSSNGNSPNRSSDDSDFEFVVDRTNEREELGDDGPILNLTNIDRFQWRIKDEEKERQKKRRKEKRQEREYRPPTQEDISFWNKRKEDLKRNPPQREKVRYSSWDDEPAVAGSRCNANVPSTSGWGEQNPQQNINRNHFYNFSKTSFHNQHGYRQNFTRSNSFQQSFNYGNQLRSSHVGTNSPVVNSLQRPVNQDYQDKSGPIYNSGSRNSSTSSNEDRFSEETTFAHAGQNQLMPKRRKQKQFHQSPKTNPSFSRGYNQGSRS